MKRKLEYNKNILKSTMTKTLYFFSDFLKILIQIIEKKLKY